MSITKATNACGQQIFINVPEDPNESNVTDKVDWEIGTINVNTGINVYRINRMRTKNYIPIWKKGARLGTSQPDNGGIVIVYYDKNFKFEGIDPGNYDNKKKLIFRNDKRIQIPAKQHQYMRVIFKASDLDDELNEYDAKANCIIKNGISIQQFNDAWKNKTLIFFGTSISQGQTMYGNVQIPYPKVVALHLGAKELLNYSIGGTTIAAKSNYGGIYTSYSKLENQYTKAKASWEDSKKTSEEIKKIQDKWVGKYFDVFDTTNIQKYFSYYVKEAGDHPLVNASQMTRTPLCKRKELLKHGTDAKNNKDDYILVIAAGSNDFQYNWTDIGNPQDRSDTTLYGALNNLFIWAIENYGKDNVFYCAHTKRAQSPYTTPQDENNFGVTLAIYEDIIKECCDNYKIPFIDAYKEVGRYLQNRLPKISGIDKNGLDPAKKEQTYLFDNVKTHPLQPAHNLIGIAVSNKIKEILDNR